MSSSVKNISGILASSSALPKSAQEQEDIDRCNVTCCSYVNVGDSNDATLEHLLRKPCVELRFVRLGQRTGAQQFL